MVKILGLSGIAGAGKDTAALTIKESKKNVDIYAFAGPLKEACRILFNFSNEQLYDTVVKEEYDERWKRSPREIFQWLGTDVLRNHVNQDFFIMNMQQRIDSSKADYIVITDVRFDNEAEYVKSLGGKVIKIERNMDESSENNGKTTKHSQHITEKGISTHLIDAVVKNNCSIDEFKNNMLGVIDSLFREE